MMPSTSTSTAGAAAAPIHIRRSENAPGGLRATLGTGPDATSLHAATPGGSQFYGATPGGTRLMYTRDQLLALASSPLAQSPPVSHKIHASRANGHQSGQLPPQISRSPPADYAQGGGFGGSAGGIPSSFGSAGAAVGGGGGRSIGRSPEKRASGRTASGASAGAGANGGSLSGLSTSPITFQRKFSGAAINGAATSPVSQQDKENNAAPVTTPRSPGNAFNFAAPIRGPSTPSAAGAGSKDSANASADGAGGMPPSMSSSSISSSALGTPTTSRGFVTPGSVSRNGGGLSSSSSSSGNISASAASGGSAGINKKMSGLALGRPGGATPPTPTSLSSTAEQATLAGLTPSTFPPSLANMGRQASTGAMSTVSNVSNGTVSSTRVEPPGTPRNGAIEAGAT